jgi:hypothetical protein
MGKALTLALALTLGSIAMHGQVAVGARGGVPITDFFDAVSDTNFRYFTDTKRYEIGPSLEYQLPLQFLIGVDALYRRIGFDYQETSTGIFRKTVANSWQFPVMVKWEFLPGPLRPFVGAGAAYQYIGGIQQTQQISGGPATVNSVAELNKRNQVGFVFGGGLAVRVGPLKLVPEFRYSRWGSEAFRDPLRQALRTHRNQGDFLLGVLYSPPR